MRKRTLAREYALQILYQLEFNPRTITETLTSFWHEFPDVEEEIRNFTERLVQGTERNKKEIDEVIIRAVQNWEMSRIAVLDRNILRFAAYELLYMDDIPPKVTINEAVNLAKKFSQEESGKFVNGILDRITHSEKTRTEPPHENSRR